MKKGGRNFGGSGECGRCATGIGFILCREDRLETASGDRFFPSLTFCGCLAIWPQGVMEHRETGNVWGATYFR